jgi:AcrR family transcriptional regulator
LSIRGNIKKPTKPLRADAQRNRQALIAAAREVFDRGQFELPFDDFAALAGLGIGTLYRHFPTRKALVEAVYRNEIDGLCESARQLRLKSSPGEALATFLRTLVAHMDARQGLARTLVLLTTPSDPAIAESSRALEQAVRDMISAAAKAGEIREDIDAGAVMMVLHGIGASLERPNWRKEAKNVLTLLLDGLRQRRGLVNAKPLA